MNRIKWILPITGILFSLLPAVCLAELGEKTEISLYSAAREIEYYVNNKDAEAIISNFSEQAVPDLAAEIRSGLKKNSISFSQSNWKIEEITADQYRVEARYAIAVNEGSYRWNVSGMKVYYVFERAGDGWLLVDTNLGEALTGAQAKEFLKYMLPVLAGVLFLGGIIFVYLIFIRPRKKA